MKENDAAKILLVEDDRNTSYLLREDLTSRGYAVEVCYDGKDGFRHFRTAEFSLCILDVMLPKMDGFRLAKKIRLIDEFVPIIFLTSRSMESDKLQGFKIGCDDYITKPFSMMELDYRIQAVLKRNKKSKDVNGSEAYTLGVFEFDYRSRLLKFPDKSERKLTMKETELLKLLCENRNRLVTRSFLMNHIWGDDDYFISRSMDVYMTRIRSLLKSDPSIEIANIYGTGYQLNEKRN